MQFLAIFGVMLAFGFFFPTLFRIFYWLFIPLVFTLGPGSFLYLVSAILGWGLSFTAACLVSFIFVALPFTIATSPK